MLWNVDLAPSPTTASVPTSSTSTNKVVILGAGPAGALAAITARREGAQVELIERSSFPRHKVCGEFLSPEIAPVLEQAGVLAGFLARKPWSVRTMSVCLGKREKRTRLPEAAFGLSRYSFDQLLFEHAERCGAERVPEGIPGVLATGRGARGEVRGDRLFGFKAHFEGASDDAVELFFLRNAYVGINCIEGGLTNVCGLAPESELSRVSFEPEAILLRNGPLRARLHTLGRSMRWIFTGPLEFRQNWQDETAYRAGDALSFVDPFTGSGLLCAALTGSLAGLHAARRVPAAQHRDLCRRAIGRPYFFSSMLRSLAGTEWAEWLLPFVPSRVLYRLTRPRMRSV